MLGLGLQLRLLRTGSPARGRPVGLADGGVDTQNGTDRHSSCWGPPSAEKPLPTLAEPSTGPSLGRPPHRQGGSGQPSTWAEKFFFPTSSSSDSWSDPAGHTHG